MCDVCNYIASTIRLDKMREDEVFSALDRLVEDGWLECLGEVDSNSPRYAIRYSCGSCGAVWVFTVPDHAFEGGLVRTQ